MRYPAEILVPVTFRALWEPQKLTAKLCHSTSGESSCQPNEMGCHTAPSMVSMKINPTNREPRSLWVRMDFTCPGFINPWRFCVFLDPLESRYRTKWLQGDSQGTVERSFKQSLEVEQGDLLVYTEACRGGDPSLKNKRSIIAKNDSFGFRSSVRKPVCSEHNVRWEYQVRVEAWQGSGEVMEGDLGDRGQLRLHLNV